MPQYMVQYMYGYTTAWVLSGSAPFGLRTTREGRTLADGSDIGAGERALAGRSARAGGAAGPGRAVAAPGITC
jgi:hypothetical protein